MHPDPHRRTPRRLRLLSALLLALPTWLCAAQPAPDHYRIAGYVTHWPASSGKDLPKLDILIFAFAKLTDGKVGVDAQAAKELQRVVSLKRKRPGLEVDISVGGWSAGGFSEAARSEAGRKLFAETAAAMVAGNGADGLDVDWEYPGHHESGIASSPEDRANFTLLLKAVRASLDRAGSLHGNRHYALTVAIADGPFVDDIDIPAVDQVLDRFNLMTYDFFNSLTPITGHHAGLYAPPYAPADARSGDKAVRQFLAAGVAPAKLMLGAAFYGREFADVQPAHEGLYQRYGRYVGAPSWPQLQQDYFGKRGFVRHWDAEAKAPYLWNPDTRQLVSYEDPQSLAAKAAYVKSLHLGGIMYWEQSQDPQGELLGAIRKGLD